MNVTVMYAKYNKDCNKAIYDVLSGMSCEEREAERGSFYNSLSSLFRHIIGGTWYFMDVCKTALTEHAAVEKALSSMPALPEQDAPLTDEEWKELGTSLEKIDAAYITLAKALNDEDLKHPVSLDWYGGDPAAVPVNFMLNQLVVHGTHHRGQISQILDSLKIKHDFSGISVKNL